MKASLIPGPLARQIDRLARRAHAFHRFAHHPLCDAYRSEVMRFGKRLRLCKGCAYFTLGFAVGIGVGAATRPTSLWGAGGLLVALVLTALSLRARLPKLLGRLLPGACFGLALWTGWPCAAATLGVVGLFGLLYRRRGSERSRCESCHERQRQPCPGFVLIVRRERAFQRRANGWIRALRSGPSEHVARHGGRK